MEAAEQYVLYKDINVVQFIKARRITRPYNKDQGS